MTTYTLRRLFIAVTALAVAVAMLVQGTLLQLQNPRSNDEDNLAWGILALGMFLLGTGASVPFMRLRIALLVGLAAPFVAFMVLVALLWGYILWTV